MTTDKDLKRRVRERAAKTGESYTTARMHLIGAAAGKTTETPRHRGGASPETTALRNTLARLGVSLSEGMILGAGGGIGAGYIAITHGMTGFMLGSRALWWDSPAFVTAACERLGVPIALKETSSARAAVKNVRETLEAGAPALVWLDQASLPYTTLPPHFRKGGYHVAVVYELDESADRAVLGDTASRPFTVTAAVLAEARASITSFKHRTGALAAPAGQLDLARAALSGIRACAEGLVTGRARTFVLDGFRAWGAAVGAARGKDAWATLFPPGPHLLRALGSTYRFVEQWAGPALLRPLYADFLDEAAALCGRPALREAAARYRDCASLWHDVARAALPDGVPALRERRELMERSRRMLDEQGDAAIGPVQATLSRLRELQAAAEEQFPLDSAEVADLLADLSRRILAAHEAEVAARETLAAASS